MKNAPRLCQMLGVGAAKSSLLRTIGLQLLLVALDVREVSQKERKRRLASIAASLRGEYIKMPRDQAENPLVIGGNLIRVPFPHF